LRCWSALITLLVSVLVRRFNRDWPFMLVGLIGGAGTAFFLQSVRWATWTLCPAPERPLDRCRRSCAGDRLVAKFQTCWALAVALSIVAPPGSISVAKTVAVRSGQRIDPNREFVGRDCRTSSWIFSSYVSCGSAQPRSLPILRSPARVLRWPASARPSGCCRVGGKRRVAGVDPMAAIAACWCWLRGTCSTYALRRLARLKLQPNSPSLPRLSWPTISNPHRSGDPVRHHPLAGEGYLHRPSRPGDAHEWLRQHDGRTAKFVVVDDAKNVVCPSARSSKLFAQWKGLVYSAPRSMFGDRLFHFAPGSGTAEAPAGEWAKEQ